MGINTAQQFLKAALDQTLLPLDLGTLTAYIAPPNPGDAVDPAIYIWGSRGNERRMTIPRAQPGDLSTGGNKQQDHSVDCWIVWFGPSADPNADVQFPAVIDTVMAVLRNVTLNDAARYVYDPVTGQASELLNVGENMTWDYAPVRAVADQRYLRYDALVTVEILEVFQA